MENVKLAAQKLLKIAEAIENGAAQHSFFVCHSCNHTASLASINGKRSKLAGEAGIKQVAQVTVNDKISCPACEGTMEYVATERSKKYYVEAADPVQQGAAPAPALDLPPSGDSDVFQPVDEQKKKLKKDDTEPGEEEDIDLDVGEEGLPEETEEKTPEEAEIPEMPKTPKAPKMDVGPEGIPSEEMDKEPPAEEPPAEETPAEEGAEPVVEEEVPGEEKPKKKKVQLPKMDVPKFEKMPKEAAQRDFMAAIAKYTYF